MHTEANCKPRFPKDRRAMLVARTPVRRTQMFAGTREMAQGFKVYPHKLGFVLGLDFGYWMTAFWDTFKLWKIWW